jgi:hypothetical protein
MQPRRMWTWLLDDWTRAVHRSFITKLPYQVYGALRLQWRMGQAVKTNLLLLPLLLIGSFLLPRQPITRWLLQGWTALELLLLSIHLSVGVRHKVSYSWALHHLQPLVLTGGAARYDLRQKAWLAALLGVFLLATFFYGG